MIPGPSTDDAEAPCWVCGHLFSYAPNPVPYRDPSTGELEPICGDCVDRVNSRRVENGLLPITPGPEVGSLEVPGGDGGG